MLARQVDRSRVNQSGWMEHLTPHMARCSPRGERANELTEIYWTDFTYFRQRFRSNVLHRSLSLLQYMKPNSFCDLCLHEVLVEKQLYIILKYFVTSVITVSV